MYTVLINSGTRAVPSSSLEAAFDRKGIDWLRLGSGQYVIYTNIPTAEEVFNVAHSALNPADYVTVLELADANRYGYVQDVVRNWFAKAR